MERAPRTGTTRGRAVTAVVAAPALALLLAGCGSGGLGGSDTSELQDKALQLTECLRKQGLDVEDPVNGAPAPVKGADPQKLEKAMEACRKYQLPRTGGDADDHKEDVRRGLKMAECLRKNGVPSWPDPKADGGFPPVPEAMSDPDREAAEKKCQAELPDPEEQ
ncbi:hypothetical protein ACIBCM_10800 [Streptomyces sp. NPDC051018]|uniref:hypothetical protein n=1 Tax=Streptomyces sp. NPDC051018 TaxID=3365639 RepID=UPI0037A50425